MLALKQALSLVTIGRRSNEWSPILESSLAAWYKFNTGIGLTGSDVRSWADSGTKGLDMLQGTAANQPAFSAGVLTFDPSAPSFLSTSGDEITLPNDFTIGVRLNIAATGGIIVGDNTEDGELVKVFSNNKIAVRIDNQTRVDLQLDSGSLLESESYMVITRTGGSGDLKLWWNGVQQASSAAMTGTANIDSIGVRKTNANPFDGTIREIQVYTSANDTLTANVGNRLSTL
jgi:hypothetical protein